MWKIQWNGDGEQCVRTVQQLDDLLDRLHAEYEGGVPVLVVIESPMNGDSLAVAVGSSISVVSFVSGSGDPPYFTSLGAHSDEGTIEFNFMGHLSECSRTNAVPIDVAREVVRQFFRTGALSELVQWEQD